NGDSTQNILPLNVSPGQTVTLSAAGSTDRDSDTLSFMWWQYKEAGTYDGSVTITKNTAETTEVSIPQNGTSGEEIHIVLSVKDNASPYPLTSHRRIIFTVAGSTVACVGDSITEGYPTSGTGYPKNLDDILPNNYTVLNFGKSNTTALPLGLGNDPYVETSQYDNAIASDANVFVIMLGTNDVKEANWPNRAHFKTELQGIVEDFLDLSPSPKVYLATQVPSFNSQNTIDPVRIETYMGPHTRELANELNIQGIDTYTPFIGRSDLFKDGIHPNTSGNELLASVIQDAITAPDDHQAPSTPSGVTATAPSTTSVTLTWSASSGTPSGYEIYRGEECVKVVAAATRSFTETGLAPGIYNYQVRAFDRALNLSAKSAVVSIDTRGSTPDIDPPSVPTGLSGTVSGTSITLTWNASTDNRGVSGYEVRRGTSTSIG
ncbi:MAG TPA: GDSL-type esterase/lipase family protein, partial [Opitutales bacterium]|nr:GDSL-type esterase/lipase family protein [Opitutales bacterium]